MEALNNLKKNWLVLVAVAVLTILGGMGSATIANRNEKVEGAASVEYVDKENLRQDVKTDRTNTRQDADLRTLHDTKSDKTEVQSLQSDVREIRIKTDKILELLIEKK